ncbi:MAG: hypothetical protein QE271_09935 [Bacteriovoracaceae bacterium]|nr:hypothetical protein [Bacteriovoracaceae bacterium]
MKTLKSLNFKLLPTVMLMGLSLEAFSVLAETTLEGSLPSRRKVALKNPTTQNEMIRKKPEKKYYQQSLSTRYASTTSTANGNANQASGSISTLKLPGSTSPSKAPNILSMMTQFSYTTNATSFGTKDSTTGATIELFLTVNLNSTLALLLETGATKNIDAPTGSPNAHSSNMNNTNIGGKIAAYKDSSWDIFFRGYYIAPTSLASREQATMTGGYRTDATIIPTLYKGDVLNLTYRFRPAYSHFYYDELINKGNDLPNLENRFDLGNRLGFNLWGSLDLNFHFIYTTFQNSLGVRVDDQYTWVQEVEYAVNPNFFIGLSHSINGAFYNAAGSREVVSIYSSKSSEFTGYFGIQF